MSGLTAVSLAVLGVGAALIGSLIYIADALYRIAKALEARAKEDVFTARMLEAAKRKARS